MGPAIPGSWNAKHSRRAQYTYNFTGGGNRFNTRRADAIESVRQITLRRSSSKMFHGMPPAHCHQPSSRAPHWFR
jgi:hypothetical protein